MVLKKSVIETGVDKLVKIVADAKKISVRDAAKELGVSVSSIEEWADFLEEEGIISIEHQFATVYLVEKRIGKKELAEKVAAVKDEKESFMRKVESSLNSIERDSEEIKLIDSEFKEIKGVLEDNFTKLNKKLEKLDDFRKSHRDIELKRKEVEEGYEKKINALEQKLRKEQDEYHAVMKSVEDELRTIKEERDKVSSMNETEKQLRSKVAEINRQMEQVRREIEKENEQLLIDEERLKKSESAAKSIREAVSAGTKELESVNESVKKSRIEIERLENEFTEDIERLGKGDLEKIGAYKESKELVDKFRSFFSQTREIEDLIHKAEKEEDEIRSHFESLAKKVAAFSIITSEPDIKAQMDGLRKELAEIESRKSLLSSQLKKLRSIVRSVTG
jgi:chromosome segregation ATPase